MGLGEGSLNGQRFVHRNEGLAAQHPAESLDLVRRPPRQVRDGMGLALAGLAIALAEENRRRRRAIGDGGDVQACIIDSISV